jgi:hypothetical protein
MTQATAQRSGPERAEELPRHIRLLLRQSRRRGQLPPPVCAVRVERAVPVPMADGVTLVADHYWPDVAGPAPTVLVRCPYGRGFPYDWMYGALLAGQGFHVVIQSCRGTAGSGGELEPYVNEAADGQATVTWLRDQDWFNGALGMIGASYLGFVQWALAADPPPELKAMVVQVSADDFYGFLFPGGAFALDASLAAVAATLSQQHGFVRFLLAVLRLALRHRRAAWSLPFRDAYPAALGQRVAWYEEWLAHPAADDPFWNSRRAGPRLADAPPVSLLGGWSDVCLDPTLDLYRRLRVAGREVRLVVGPWNHTSGFNNDMPIVLGEALRWLRAHLSGGGTSDGGTAADPAGRPATAGGAAGDTTGGGTGDAAGAGAPEITAPVRVWFGTAGEGAGTGAGPGPREGARAVGGWRDLADWPPPGTVTTGWRLSPGGTLIAPGAETGGMPGEQAVSAAPAVSAFRYDPNDPVPAVGGPVLGGRGWGTQRNDALEARSDVITFTAAPLPAALEVAGPVSVRLRVRGSSPYFDVFARLCDVDPAGHSWNVCDGILQISGRASQDGAGQDRDRRDEASRDGTRGDDGTWTEITVPMSSAAHLFAPGHRVRLQLSGGAHPRFARNTGTGEPFATATTLVPVDIEIAHDPARPGELSLPSTLHPATTGPGAPVS